MMRRAPSTSGSHQPMVRPGARAPARAALPSMSAQSAPVTLVRAEPPGHGLVHLGRHLADPFGLGGEVAPGLGRVGGLERRATPAPRASPGGGAAPMVYSANSSRNDVRAMCQPSVAPARNRCRKARSTSSLRHDASGAGHDGEPGGGQGLDDLDLGVVALGEPPEHLEDHGVVVDQRRVRLLGAEGPDPLGRDGRGPPPAAAPVPVRRRGGRRRPGPAPWLVSNSPSDGRLVARARNSHVDAGRAQARGTPGSGRRRCRRDATSASTRRRHRPVTVAMDSTWVERMRTSSMVRSFAPNQRWRGR